MYPAGEDNDSADNTKKAKSYKKRGVKYLKVNTDSDTDVEEQANTKGKLPANSAKAKTAIAKKPNDSVNVKTEVKTVKNEPQKEVKKKPEMPKVGPEMPKVGQVTQELPEKQEIAGTKAKIEVYLNDDKRVLEKEPEKKIIRKTFEEAFLASIQDNLGPRNASKRPYNPYSFKAKSERKDSDNESGTDRTEQADEGKTSSEPEVKKVKTDIRDEILDLKDQTSKFLKKYKKDKIDEGTNEGKTIKTEEEVASGSNQSYVCKKKMAVSQHQNQKGTDSIKSEMKQKADVPKELVEKHKDLGRELIQLTHDIIQQQTNKSHRYVEYQNEVARQKATSRVNILESGRSQQMNNSPLISRPVFQETVSSRLMQSIRNPSNPMYGDECGKHASTNSLDFSLLASQAETSKRKLIDSTAMGMNLQSTINKLSTALHTPAQVQNVTYSQKQQISVDSSHSEMCKSLHIDVHKAANPEGMISPVGSASSGVTSPRSIVSPSSGGDTGMVKSPRLGVRSPIAMIPGQGLRSPTSHVPPASVFASSHLPSGRQRVSPNGSARGHGFQTQSQFSSPPIILRSPESSLSQHPPKLSPVMLKPSHHPLQSTSGNAVNTQSVIRPIHTIQSGNMNFQNVAMASSSAHQSGMGSLNPSTSSLQTTTQNMHILQQSGGNVLLQGQTPTQLQMPFQANSPNISLRPSPNVVVRHQPIQNTLQSASPGSSLLNQSQIVTMNNPGMVQLGLQGTTTSAVSMQQRLVTNGNQTFLVHIPVMRPISSTSTTASSGVVVSTGNIVTSASSQGKQNNVGHVIVQNDAAIKVVKTVPQNSQNVIEVLKVTQANLVTVPTNKVASAVRPGRQTVSNLLLASKNAAAKTNVIPGQSVVSIVGNPASLLPNLNGGATVISTNVSEALSGVSSQVMPSTVKLSQGENQKENPADISIIKNTENDHDYIGEGQASLGSNFPHEKPPAESGTVGTNNNEISSPAVIEFKEASPPPRLQSPNKPMQLIPQPIVPISQTFTSCLSSSVNSLCNDPSTYNCTMPTHLFEGEDSDDNKPPTLEMEAPMLEMEAPILKLEADIDAASVKSDPDTLSNYSLSGNPISVGNGIKSDQDGLPVYQMNSGNLDLSQTVIQTTSYNSFTGTGKTVVRRRRKSNQDRAKENKSKTNLADTDDESEPSHAKKVSILVE